MGGVRPRWAEAIQEEFSAEWFRELAADVKGATKGVWVDVVCRECGCQQKAKAEVRDLARILTMAKEMTEQAEGKPGTADAERGGITLVVKGWMPDAGDPGPADVSAAS